MKVDIRFLSGLVIDERTLANEKEAFFRKGWISSKTGDILYPKDIVKAYGGYPPDKQLIKDGYLPYDQMQVGQLVLEFLHICSTRDPEYKELYEYIKAVPYEERSVAFEIYLDDYKCDLEFKWWDYLSEREYKHALRWTIVNDVEWYADEYKGNWVTNLVLKRMEKEILEEMTDELDRATTRLRSPEAEQERLAMNPNEFSDIVAYAKKITEDLFNK